MQNLSNFYQLDRIPDQEADMFTLVFMVHRPYFQHPETKDYWTQDMAYEWKTFPHPFLLDHDPTIISTLKAYLLELNNIQPVPTNIHHTSSGPSHTLEVILRTQICTPVSSSSPHGILVREQRPNYTNVLFQDAQDLGKVFNLYCQHKKLSTLSLNQVLRPLQLQEHKSHS